MVFVLDDVVPWGRRYNEYLDMFHLSDDEIRSSRIVSFGDGPASFNAEGTMLGGTILSVDPIYQYSGRELETRLNEVRSIIIEQARENSSNYVWNRISDISELERLRMSAVSLFLSDFEQGLN